MLRIFAAPRGSVASQRYLSSAESIINTSGFRFWNRLADDLACARVDHIAGVAHKDETPIPVMLQPALPVPIRVNNVADVDVGYAPRLGAVSMNHRKEVVEGIVLMRKYWNTLDTLAGAKAKIASLNASNIMPRGYRLVPFYDRTKLVETTLHTVFENLTIGMVLVFLVLVFFLGNIRSAVVAAVNVPLALLGAFTP
jgi:Cu/Ag efflux pump CusA